MKNNFEKIEEASNKRFEFIKNPFLILAIIGIVGLFLRIYYFPHNVPLSLDGIDYFVYATAIVQQGQFPDGILPTNNGWSTFLSVLFYFFHSTNMMDLMNLQRYASITISVLTIIPVYFLCKKFVGNYSALVGASLFCFDPRIIQNSLLGLTESLYIFLGALAFVLFFGNKIKMMYISSVIIALLSLVRYEGLLLFIPLSIMFFIRFRNNEKSILKYFAVVGIFILVMLPMAMIRIEHTGNDGLISNIFSSSQLVSKIVIGEEIILDDSIVGKDDKNKLGYFITTSLINLVKYLGWITIPLFICFLPFGIFKILKNKDRKIIIFLCVVGIIMLIPAMYAYGRNFQETRYLYIIFPLLCIISGYSTIFLEKIPRKNTIFVCILVGIIFTSIGFLEYKKTDYKDEEERYVITMQVINIAKGVNDYQGNKYVKVATIEKNWPSSPELDNRNRTTYELKKISSGDSNTLEEYIKSSKDLGLTHLVIESKNKLTFLDDVFYNDSKYPYLIKQYDSDDQGFKTQIRIYKINYNYFESL